MFLYLKLQEGRNCASFPALVCFQHLEQSLRTGGTKQLLNEWKSSIDSKSSTWNLGNTIQRKYPPYPSKGYVVLTSDVSVKVVSLSIPLGSLPVYSIIEEADGFSDWNTEGMYKRHDWLSPDVSPLWSESWEHKGIHISPSSGNTTLVRKPPYLMLPKTGTCLILRLLFTLRASFQLSSIISK